jgi:hypothetical protein
MEVINASVGLATVLSDRSYAEGSPDSAKEAESILLSVREIRVRALDPSDWRLGVLDTHLAYALAAQGTRLAEARALAHDGWERMRIPESVVPRVRSSLRMEALGRIVRVCETSERLAPGSTDAAEWGAWKEELRLLTEAENRPAGPK